MKLKDGTSAEYGDVIRWRCWDSDDFVTWTMTGLYTRKGIVYLGGGIDFGAGIGQILDVDEVEDDAENNDSIDQGIERLGKCCDLAVYIKAFGT